MDWEDFRALGCLAGRVDITGDGKPTLRFRATDPAFKQTVCSCGRPECRTQLLLPLRQHISALMKGIFGLGMAGLLPDGPEAWPGVVYDLQLAGSLEDVFADPSFIDESDAWAYCEPAWESDEEHREAASKYLAATVIFNFVWSAYESSIQELPFVRKPKDSVAGHGRKILDVPAIVAADVPMLETIYRSTHRFCRRLPQIREQLDKADTQYHSLVARSAELARMFRNHMVHGADPRPEAIEEGEQACQRIYAVTRVTLILIQLLALRAVDGSKTEIELSMRSETREPAECALRNLHMVREAWSH